MLDGLFREDLLVGEIEEPRPRGKALSTAILESVNRPCQLETPPPPQLTDPTPKQHLEMPVLSPAEPPPEMPRKKKSKRRKRKRPPLSAEDKAKKARQQEQQQQESVMVVATLRDLQKQRQAGVRAARDDLPAPGGADKAAAAALSGTHRPSAAHGQTRPPATAAPQPQPRAAAFTSLTDSVIKTPAPAKDNKKNEITSQALKQVEQEMATWTPLPPTPARQEETSGGSRSTGTTVATNTDTIVTKISDLSLLSADQITALVLAAHDQPIRIEASQHVVVEEEITTTTKTTIKSVYPDLGDTRSRIQSPSGEWVSVPVMPGVRRERCVVKLLRAFNNAVEARKIPVFAERIAQMEAEKYTTPETGKRPDHVSV